jgi:hypothetical protein
MPHNILGAQNPSELAGAMLDASGVGSFATEDAVAQEFKVDDLAAEVMSKVETAKANKFEKEDRMFRNVQSFKGLDNTNDKLRQETELADVYMRTTTVKTRAAFAQIIEALLSDSRFPIQIKESRNPDGVAKLAHLGGEPSPEEQGAPPEQQAPTPDGGVGFAGDGFELTPGATIGNLSFLGGAEEDLGGEEGITEGPGRMGEPQIRPAKMAATKMDMLIQDQLMSGRANTHLRQTIFECCMLGVGALKGPFNVTKTLPNWERDDAGVMQYRPIQKKFPQISFVSYWNLFVDPEATSMEDADWVAEKHRFTARQVLELKQRSDFDENEIDGVIADGPNYTEGSHESQLNESNNGTPINRFEVWEFWGYMPTEDIRERGIEVPEDSGDTLQINMWYSGSRVLRLVLNPFQPARIPYYVIPYEEKPYQIEGTGVPEAMEDSQKLMNGFARLSVENAALAGNVILDVDESALVEGQEMTLYPGKIFKRQAGFSGSAINAIKFQDTSQSNLAMMREFRQHADEATGIPSISHGQTGVSGFGRTAGGMSMLLNNASLNIKTVIRNIDEHLLRPLGRAYFNWNMQFNSAEMPEIVGDLDISPMGAKSLQMQEVNAQRIQTFLQISANPALAPLVKLPVILKDLALSMDMDPEEILNNPDEAQFYARLMGAMGAAGMQPRAGGENPSPENPLPGQQGFTGNNAGAGNQAGVNGREAPPQ